MQGTVAELELSRDSLRTELEQTKATVLQLHLKLRAHGADEEDSATGRSSVSAASMQVRLKSNSQC